MHVGEALLAHARAAGKRSIVVVGTGKNVGKTVTAIALADALHRAAVPFGMCSIGHDGEAFDAVEGTAKPRLLLRPGTLCATAVGLLPRHPAAEIVELTGEETAVGLTCIVRVRSAGFFETAGPPSASSLRRIIERLFAQGAHTVIVDGAVDRMAAVRDTDAIIVATGAASGATPSRVVDDAGTLTACLRLATADPARPAFQIEGALTASLAADLIRRGEQRQVVVRDPTRIAVSGRGFAALTAALDVRCERPLHPVACTVASSFAARTFEPLQFLRTIAARVALPCYDVYAGARA